MASSAPSPSLHGALSSREYGRLKYVHHMSLLPPSMHERLNVQFNNISDSIRHLKTALDNNRLPEVEEAVTTLINRLLDNPNPSVVFVITPIKRQERETFVSLGGMDQLLRFFSKPFGDRDARNIPAVVMQRRHELWNEVLVIMREVAFAVPTLSAHLFSQQHVIFLFTLLSHAPVFENTMNLLEEILSCRSETFSLATVPRLFALLGDFSTRQLAHFCRVLSLVLFEPEDRLIMEGSQVLRSTDLLQLRRDRMAKANNTVEKNQVLIIEMPCLLERLVHLMRFVNYGPQLADVIRYNIVQQAPITSDLLVFHSTDWRHFLDLDRAARGLSSEPGPATAAAAAATRASSSSSSSSNKSNGSLGGTSGGDASPLPPWARAEADAVMVELLTAFSPSPSSRGGDVESLHSVVSLAVRLGIATATTQGEQLLDYGPAQRDRAPELPAGLFAALAGGGGGLLEVLREWPRGRIGGRGGAQQRGEASPTQAQDARQQAATRARVFATTELMFHSMLLAPHQVELFFVLCTLLSGRRKIDVQVRLARLGLADVLLDMFDRLSWDAPPFTGPNPLEHIHGPGCECNPESALRVQFMRLVHNFYDRDFTQNTNKTLLLSPSEQQLLYAGEGEGGGDDAFMQRGQLLPRADRGLLRRIIDALVKEAPESVYRFWLSSCLEAYLRGSGQREQLFVARAGVLAHTTQHILSVGTRATTNLQTSFDLLGEIVKNNADTLDMLEEALTAQEGLFGNFMDVVMGNLVDSNVFLRSLYLSLECASETFAAKDRAEGREPGRREPLPAERERAPAGYLTHSWEHFSPTPLAHGAGLVALSFSSSSSSTIPAASGTQTIGASARPPSPTSFGLGGTVLSVRGALLSLIGAAGAGGADGKDARAPDDREDRDGPGDFFTPPEAPRYRHSAGEGAQSGAAAAAAAADTSSPASVDLPFPSTPPRGPDPSPGRDRQRDSPARDNRLGLSWANVTPPSSTGWTLPDGLFRLGVFLTRERETVLLRLMDTVTVRSINHENICCLNTALLLLVLAHRRGQLPLVLGRVRRLADEKAAIAGLSEGPLGVDEDEEEEGEEDEGEDEDASLQIAEEDAAALDTGGDEEESGCLLCLPVGSEQGRGDCASCSGCGSGAAEGSARRRAGVGLGSARPSAPRPLGGGDRVMSNFRELLWFWREYYLRRGRDRLSIEFSSRIPFPYWLDLVDLLCKDDASPTSLVRNPPTLPLSPYCRPSRFSSSSEYWA